MKVNEFQVRIVPSRSPLINTSSVESLFSFTTVHLRLSPTPVQVRINSSPGQTTLPSMIVVIIDAAEISIRILYIYKLRSSEPLYIMRSIANDTYQHTRLLSQSQDL